MSCVKRIATDFSRRVFAALVFCLAAGIAVQAYANEDTSDNDLQMAKAAEQQRIKTINKVIGSVIAIYGEDRSGGGSGVIIDPTGIALTNHHVIMGAGVQGWGGLADGEMYRWKLIGTCLLYTSPSPRD